MQIALIQQHASADRAANVERAVAAVREAAASGAELIAFAELAFELFFPQRPRGPAEVEDPSETIPGATTERFAALAKELGVVLVLNLYERDGSDRFDSSPVIDADGTLLGTTRMLHITDYEGFHEQDYYTAGDRGMPVYDTAVGRLGVAICYDRHYPEVMRALKLAGAELVVVPQAGAVGEWPPGVYEAELQTAAFQNGYFVALCNRVGVEEQLDFAGESFICGPDGRVIARAACGADAQLLAEIDLTEIEKSAAERLFLRDRRPHLYEQWFAASSVRHALATIAYRFQKAVRGAPDGYSEVEAAGGVRPPRDIVRHMSQVILFGCRTFDPTIDLELEPLSWEQEVSRFHETLSLCDRHLASGREPQGMSREVLLQGPISDVLTHVGQLAMLRRIAGSPVPGESFVKAPIVTGEVGPNQSLQS